MTRIAKLALLLIFGLAGCAAKIDGSSDETMADSISKVRSALSEKKREEFDKALMVVGLGQISFSDLMAAGQAGTPPQVDSLRKTLDGKTADQVIAEANRIRAEREEKERQEALEEIKELETKQAATIQAINALKKFRVLRSRFRLEQDYFKPQPIIELRVQNDTPHAISRAFFEGTLASPGRSVPWHRDTFNYSIPGGLEPGESATWRLAPNMFSDWGNIKAPADAIFTVTVQRIDGANDQTLFDATEFTDNDRNRLLELRRQYQP